MVDGIIDLHDSNLESGIDQSQISEELRIVDQDGNSRNDLNSEFGSFLVKSANIICLSDCQFSDYNPYLVSDGTYNLNKGDMENVVGRAHAHPNAGERFIIANGRTGTWSYSVLHERTNAGNTINHFSIVVDHKSIHLYNKTTVISTDRKFFEK